jgi:hypothetical protein
LKFSVSEARLEKSLDGLRALNQDFRTLAGQTTSLDSTQQHAPAMTSGIRSDRTVRECTLVRKASSQLHQAMAKACQMHEEHLAYFRLDSQRVNTEAGGPTLVRFNMAFTHRPSASSTTVEPVWIAIDSNCDEPDSSSKGQIEAEQKLSDLSSHLKRENQQPVPTAIKRLKTKSVRFAARAKQTFVATLVTDPSLPDFCEQHDFCLQLQKRELRLLEDNHNYLNTASKYLGYFEKSRHLVYFAPPIANCPILEPVSLTQLMHSINASDGFLQYERLRLARQLAAAVLQFHATPLLKSSWHSDDVIFFGTDTSTNSITPPHLNVQVGKSSQPGLISTTHESPSFIRNSYLFHLGVILIELAYQAPLSTLRRDQDSLNCPNHSYADFFTADRISRSMVSSLGARYAKVVRKCLGCNFGEGTTELEDPVLQSLFYRDVVCELERLEKGFAMLQLG